MLVLTENLAHVLDGKFAFKSIYRKGSLFEFSVPLNKYDYVEPCFDEDVDNHNSSTSGLQFSTLSVSE